MSASTPSTCEDNRQKTVKKKSEKVYLVFTKEILVRYHVRSDPAWLGWRRHVGFFLAQSLFLLGANCGI